MLKSGKMFTLHEKVGMILPKTSKLANLTPGYPCMWKIVNLGTKKSGCQLILTIPSSTELLNNYLEKGIARIN